MKFKFPLFKSLTIPIYLPNFCQVSNNNFQLPSYKYFYYGGSLDEINNIEFLINVCSNLLNENLHLVIAGVGKNYDTLKNRYRNPNIVFLGKIDPDFSRFLMRNALILLSFRIDYKKITDYSFPFKLMEYISSNTPIFTSYISSFESLGGLERLLTTFSYSDSVQTIQEKLNFMIANIENFRENASRLYKDCFLQFNIKKIVHSSNEDFGYISHFRGFIIGNKIFLI
jgi:hypothetical protein